eukprot:5292399-Prymnesium_polylepis.2
MKACFVTADKANSKGAAGPAPTNELVLYEFLNAIVRISFGRLNPEFGELTMEHQDSILPVPASLDKTLQDAIMPRAHRDDAADFRAEVMSPPPSCGTRALPNMAHVAFLRWRAHPLNTCPP